MSEEPEIEVTEADKATVEVYRLEGKLRLMESERHKYIDKRVVAYRETVITEADNIYNAGIFEQRARVHEARMRRDDLQEAEGLAGKYNKTGHEPGTKLVEWERQFKGRHGGLGSTNPYWKPTGKVGIVEIITRASVHPERGSRAPLGSAVLRLLKKDGALSARYEMPTSSWLISDATMSWNDWFPEGVDMKVKEQRHD